MTSFLAKADEHKGVMLVALHTHGPGQLHSATQVTSLDPLLNSDQSLAEKGEKAPSVNQDSRLAEGVLFGCLV